MNAAAPGGHWQHQAQCRTLPPHIFEPTGGDREGIELARGVCNPCPVKIPCLRAAIAEEGSEGVQHRHGIRGGYTPAERIHIYRRYVAQPRTTA